MDSVVQLARNALCCIKDWQLLRGGGGSGVKTSPGAATKLLSWIWRPTVLNELGGHGKTPSTGAAAPLLSWIWRPSVLNELYAFPAPLDRTTPLEAVISLTQAYVVIKGVPAALRAMLASHGQLRRLSRLLDHQQSSNSGGTTTTTTTTHAERLVRASLVKGAHMALRGMLGAFCTLFISLAFVWLAANSWHITGTDWLGGHPALMHALTVMNISLLPLLYYMVADGGEKFVQAARLQRLAAQLRRGAATPADVGLTALEALAQWTPFWEGGVGPVASSKLLAAERLRVQVMLDDITGATAAQKKTDAASGESTARTRRQRETADALQPVIAVLRLEGYREYLYFVVNFIAWYGYSLCVIVYYWPDELKQPDWLRIALFHLPNDDADWHGNFAGDLMWTIEPAIALISPLMLNAARRRKPTKSKAD